MTVLYNALQCPPVTVPTVDYTKAAAFAGSGLAPVATSIPGIGNSITHELNSNAMQLDLSSRYGGGGYAVAKGLALSNGGGLNANISAGHATIDGIVELAATVQAIPPNVTPAWLWLTNAGAVVLTQGLTALVPPSASCCLLGNISTTLNGISQVDTSGVMFLRGGQLWRYTADIAAPGDTPPASASFYAQTLGGLYLWNGSAYAHIDATTASLLALIADLQAQLDDASLLLRHTYAYSVLSLDLESRPEFEDSLEQATSEGYGE